MPLLVGIVLAVAVGLLGRLAGFDKDRAFYPTVTIVVAHYYALFALMGAPTDILLVECLIGGVFLVAAIAGFRTSLWIVAMALAAHGVMDLVHGRFVVNAGVPSFWPPFCMTFDVAAAVILAGLLATGRTRAAR
ncbi:MAG TPA: hypothetical protein VF720_09165 [Candidatus Eisenbacteria bacterium]